MTCCSTAPRRAVPALSSRALTFRDVEKEGYAYAVVDGTLIPVDRVAADRPFYSGRHRKHGMNPQVIASSIGDVRGCLRDAGLGVDELAALRVLRAAQDAQRCAQLPPGDAERHGGRRCQSSIREPMMTVRSRGSRKYSAASAVSREVATKSRLRQRLMPGVFPRRSSMVDRK
jgi:hypothetical protein